jgi:hypothetical protein
MRPSRIKGLSSLGASGAAASLGALPMADGASNAPRRPHALMLRATESNMTIRTTFILAIAFPTFKFCIAAHKGFYQVMPPFARVKYKSLSHANALLNFA